MAVAGAAVLDGPLSVSNTNIAAYPPAFAHSQSMFATGIAFRDTALLLVLDRDHLLPVKP